MTIAVLLAPLAFTMLPGQATTANAAASAPVLKPLLTGLLDRTGPPPAELEDIIKSYVVNVNWKTLQPARAAPSAPGLDRALRHGPRTRLPAVEAPGDGRDPRSRLGQEPRRQAGHDARPRRQPGTVPRFWTGAFGKAYVALQKKLAARYDGNATVAEVVISRCTTFYAEPFIRQTSIASNRKALKQAGYTRPRTRPATRRRSTRTGSGSAPAPAWPSTRPSS